MPKTLRYLRVALSAVCGLGCVLMIVWWARSYSRADQGLVKLTAGEHVQFHVGAGRMCVWFEHKPTNRRFEWRSIPFTGPPRTIAERRAPIFALHFWPTFARLYAAHWFLAVLMGSLAVVPWCPRRFSLRALLLATTAIAAIAGLIVWVDKTF